MVKNIQRLLFGLALLVGVSSPLIAQTVSLTRSQIPLPTTMQNAATANANGTLLAVGGYANALISVTASVAMSGGTTINFECSADGTQPYVSISALNIGTQVVAVTATTPGDYQIAPGSYQQCRARISAYSAGTITVKGYPGNVAPSPLIAGTVTVVQPTGTNLHVVTDTGSTTVVTALPALPTGGNVIGHVVVDSGTMNIGNGSKTNTDASTQAYLDAAVAETQSNLFVGNGATGYQRVAGLAATLTAGLFGPVVRPYTATDEAGNRAPTMDVAARAGFFTMTNGTQNMPTGDAMARALFNKSLPIGDGTLRQGGTAAMTATTSTQVIAAVASNNLYVASCSVNNIHASVDTLVDLQDGSGGTVIWTFSAAHGYGGEAHVFSPPLKVPTQGNALFAVNETTGASVKVFCQGFSSTTSY